MKKFLISLSLLLLSKCLFAAVSAELETKTIGLDQSFNLYLKMDGDEANAIPNLVPLQKDFQILGSERSSNYNIINGQVSSSSQWSILLTAKAKGIFTIPPLQIGNLKTKSLTIEITDKGESTEGSQKDSSSQNDAIILEAFPSTQTPYLNQQIIYTVKLYNSARLLEANYEPPQADDALVIPFPDGKRYQTMKNGRVYMVEEQQFAIFPQKSGDLKIKPPAFHALVYETAPHQVSVEAKPQVLKVAPIPSEYQTKNWLPAKELNLYENYDKTEQNLTEGSTLTRTITVQAKGLPAQLLPNLSLDNSEQFSVYPEKASEQNELKNGDLIGTKTFKITYLLNKPGNITIPAFNLSWFNTNTNKEETTSLPPLTLNIIANNNPENKTPVALAKDNPPPIAKETIIKTKQSNLAWWIVGLLSLGWLVTLIAWKVQASKKNGQPKNKDLILKIKRACFNNDYQGAKDALLEWARLKWPNKTILNLTDLLQLIKEPKLKGHIEELSTLAYGTENKNKSWNGKPLWDAFYNYKEEKRTTTKASSLPPINKL